MARAEVLYYGDVQGVGFRFTARSVAAGFAVAGYVRNRADGRVEVAVEGMRAEIEAFLGELSSAMAHHISDVQVTWSESTGEFKGFSVRF